MRAIADRPEFLHKPVYITEFNTASSEDEGTPKDCYPPGWIEKAFDEVRNFNACHAEDRPQIHALIWFVDRPCVLGRCEPGEDKWRNFALNDSDEPNLVLARKEMQEEFMNDLTRATQCDRKLDGEGSGGGDPGGGGTRNCGSGSTTGDPHMVTLDGLAYDFQAVGEFVLAEAITGAPLAVQIRQQPLGTSRHVAVNTAVAAALGADRVALYAGRTPPLFVNGTATTLADGATLDLTSGGKVLSRGGTYKLTWPASAGERVEVTVASDHLDVRLVLPHSRKGQVARDPRQLRRRSVRRRRHAHRDGPELAHVPRVLRLLRRELADCPGGVPVRLRHRREHRHVHGSNVPGSIRLRA